MGYGRSSFDKTIKEEQSECKLWRFSQLSSLGRQRQVELQSWLPCHLSLLSELQVLVRDLVSENIADKEQHPKVTSGFHVCTCALLHTHVPVYTGAYTPQPIHTYKNKVFYIILEEGTVYEE